MKTKLTTFFMVIVAVVLGHTSTKAQGIIVHKKDGSEIKVPYGKLDKISTYNHNKTPNKEETFVVNGVTFTMVFVEGGTFEMGATPEQSNGYTPESDEYPVHTVTLSDYYIGQTEVTQELWFAVMNASPTESFSWIPDYGLGDKYPAYNICYTNCLAFIIKLNKITGATFRIPTEAEWEFAARGGNKSNGYIFSGSNSVDEVAWYIKNCTNQTHEVGTKAPNELGIYDMSGNVSEWCSEWYGSYINGSQTHPTDSSYGSKFVTRGGSWSSFDKECRVARRTYKTSADLNGGLGLRLAL